MKAYLSLIILFLASRALAQTDPTPLGYVKEGVYFWSTSSMTNILEFKGGRFRLWHAFTMPDFSRLRRGPAANTNAIPRTGASLQSGDYTTNGGMVRFVVPGGRRTAFTTNEYTFMEFGGKVSVWTPAAQKLWAKEKIVSPDNVYQATERKPEDILEGK